MLGRLSIVALLGLAGCGANPFQDNRLEVNDRLRQACSSLTDAEIRTIIESRENERLIGWTKPQALLAMNELCFGFTSECLTCANAVVNQVYGF